jgi:hypothetical protein
MKDGIRSGGIDVYGDRRTCKDPGTLYDLLESKDVLTSWRNWLSE